MADRKKTIKKSPQPRGRKRSTLPEKKSRSFLSSDVFRFGESYSSLVLGIVVVIAAAWVLVVFSRNYISRDVSQDTSSTSTEITPVTQTHAVPGETYTVREGDDLWAIAEQAYGDGNRWEEVASANEITDPNQLSVGTKLRIPESQLANAQTPSPTVTVSLTPTASATPTLIASATPTVVAKEQPSPSPILTGNQNTNGPPTTVTPGTVYKVVAGDTLWDIAERTYGSGYRWVDIAKANNWEHPDLIYPGNEFRLPK